MSAPTVSVPATGNFSVLLDPGKVIREVLAISGASQGFVQCYGQALLALLPGDKFTAANVQRLSDPPVANAQDPDVLAFQAYCAALSRGDRLITTWKGIMAGNKDFYATPPDFERGGGGDHPSPGPGGGGVPNTPAGLVGGLAAMATSNLPGLLTEIQKPQYATLISSLKAFLGGGSNVPLPGGGQPSPV